MTLAIALVLLVTITREALKAVLLETGKREELQDRWGAYSLKHMLPYLATELAEDADTPGPRKVKAASSRKFAIRLGECQFGIELQDEATKVNLNTLSTWHGSDAVLKAVATLSPGSDLVRIRPNDFSDNRKVTQWFDDWGQVFDLEETQGLSSFDWIRNSTRQLTLWGDGRLHWQRAKDDSLDFLLRKVMAPEKVAEFLKLRKTATKLESLLAELDLSERERDKAKRWLTDKSQTFRIDLESLRGEASLSQRTWICEASRVRTELTW
jgi:hypothetical protein